ncbi:MAG: hypothetical protein HKN78_09880 [Sphingomonadaceae bacterium]|nr:hypothetical protein [Sphingomonadaceae bacterium]
MIKLPSEQQHSDIFAHEYAFSDDERDRIHWRLGALLNGVMRIHRMAAAEVSRSVLRSNRLELTQHAANLIGDICGDWVKLSTNDADTPLEYIELALRTWQSPIAMHDKHDHFWFEFIDEIARLRFGDEPELLLPAPRPPGSHPQPAKISFRRLAALQWSEYLKARGLKPGISNSAVSLAFGTDWDAIRKWQRAAKKVLGEEYVETSLRHAGEGFGLQFQFPKYHEALFHYGAAYRQLLGLKLISYDAFLEATLGQDSA